MGFRPEFEQSLGELLEWQRVAPLYGKFLSLGGPAPGSVNGDMQGGVERSKAVLDRVIQILNETSTPSSGNSGLMASGREARTPTCSLPSGENLAVSDQLSIMVATTNYDRSLEVGPDLMHLRPESGFQFEPQSRPRLDARGLVERGTVSKYLGTAE